MVCKEVLVRRRFVLPPPYAADLQQGIHADLRRNIMRYNDTLGGVMLAYWDLDLGAGAGEKEAKKKKKKKQSDAEKRVAASLGSTGDILDDMPNIYVAAAYKALVFAPEAGEQMHGIVNSIGADFIGCLVYGVFNVAIGRRDIPPKFECDDLGQCWYATGEDGDEGEIAVGVKLRFSVKEVKPAGRQGVLTIRGSLLPDGCGPLAVARDLEVTIEEAEEQQERGMEELNGKSDKKVKKEKKEKKEKKDKKEKKEKKDKKEKKRAADAEETEEEQKKKKKPRRE